MAFQGYLKQSTAVDVLIGPFLDETDGKTAEAALTLAQADIKLSKNGQTLAQKSDVTSAATDADGYYNCELDATDTNTVGQLTIIVHESGALPIRLDYHIVEEAVYDAMYGASAAGPTVSGVTVNADVTAISGDTTAADNLELMYDGTGYTDDTAPASRSQVGSLSVGSAAISTKSDSATVTTGTETLTYTATGQLDGIYHEIADVGNSTEFYYEFSVGGDGVPVEFLWDGYAQSNGDSYAVKAYNWDTTSWEQVGTIAGANGTTPVSTSFQATVDHVGTGANLGLVRLQFTSSDGTHFATDRLLCSYAVVGQTVGYDGAQVWINTVSGVAGVESYVNGVADNPVDLLASAITIASNVGLSRFNCSPDSSITFAEAHTDEIWSGAGWNLNLGSQDISDTHINHCNEINGVGTSPAGEVHILDSHINTVTLGACHITRGSIIAFTASAAGAYHLDSVRSGVAGSGAPTLVFTGLGSATTINARGHLGGGTWTFDSDCTASIEVPLGGTHTITTGGGAIEFRGFPKALNIVTSGSGTTNAVVMSGAPVGISGTGGTVNIYGPHGPITDTSSGTTVNDYGADITDIPEILLDTGTNGVVLAGTPDTNAAQIGGNASAATNLAASALGIISTTVNDAGASTTAFVIASTESTDDHFIGRIIVFTSGALAGQATDITDYVGSSKTVTVTALTEAPANGVSFVIV